MYIYVYDIYMSINFFKMSAPYKSDSWIRHWKAYAKQTGTKWVI